MQTSGTPQVVGSDDGSVMLWDLESRTHPGSFIPDGRLTACTIDPAGERAILGDDLGLVHILAVRVRVLSREHILYL